MDISKYTTPGQLERGAFLWSEARLVIAAVALFAGGIPPIMFVYAGSGVWGLLKVAWIISGVASAYLAYRWYTGGQRVFGGKERNDVVAFAVSVLSGLNLGWTGLSGNNIGMSITTSRPVFIIVGALYLVSAWYLRRRWEARGEHLF